MAFVVCSRPPLFILFRTTRFVLNYSEYVADGQYLVYAVPKEAIGITEQSGKISFKWTDNVQDEDGSGEFKGEILDFYRTGDAAPGGRFKYVYSFEIPYVTLSGDINGDGDVTNKDVVALFRHVSAAQ